MKKLLFLLFLLLEGCATMGDISYYNFQKSIDKNGNKTFEFYYTNAVIEPYINNGGEQAMLDFYIPKQIAKHEFCLNGYTLLNKNEVRTGYFVQHGKCK